MVQFDLCSVIHCGTNEKGHRLSEKYICESHKHGDGCPDYQTIEDRSSGCTYSYCSSWSDVITNTGSDWGYQPSSASTGPNLLNNRLSIIKASTPRDCSKGARNPLILTLKDSQLSDSSRFVLGVYETRIDPRGSFIIVTHPNTTTENADNTQLAKKGHSSH